MMTFISHVICVGSHVQRTATIEVFSFYSDSFGAHHSLSMKPVNRIHRFWLYSDIHSIAVCLSIAILSLLLAFNQMTFPTNFCVRAAHYFFCGRGCRSVRPRARSLEGTLRGSPVFKVACRAGRWYILVARLENTIAPGRRASDFASPGKCKKLLLPM